MPNSYFQFKQFTINQEKCAMKVTTDSCLFGAWVAQTISNGELIVNNCFDIGTGTGLLSLMLAQKNPSLKIDGIEIDTNAFEQATENIANSPWASNINIILGDAKNIAFDKKYDFIISNPPFYENELKGNDIGKNIAHHNEGLLLAELLSIISNLLSEVGNFSLLLPFKRYNELKELCVSSSLSIQTVVFVKQTNQHPFFRIMVMGRKSSAENSEKLKETSLSICTQPNKYSAEFIDLLKDYYLHL